MNERTRVGESRLPTILEPVLSQLGDADRDRLKRLLPLFHDGQARFADCLQAAFPGAEQKAAQDAFRQFRKAVNDAGEDHGIEFRVDTKKKTKPEDRICWFEADSDVLDESTAKGISELVEQTTADNARLEQAGELIRPRALPTSGHALAANKQPVNLFVSYSHANEKEAEALLEELKRQLGPSRRFEYALWIDAKMLLAGHPWHEKIQAAIAACEFGLLLISPDFLTSEYITQNELPHFISGKKQAIFVGLLPVDLKLQAQGWLNAGQIFFYKPATGKKLKAFADCTKQEQRRRFAEQLFPQIEARIEEHFRKGVPASVVPVECEEERPDELHQLAEWLNREEQQHFTPPRGKAAALRNLELESPTKNEQGVDALKLLDDWACDPDSTPFFAVLGEYGIGKTTMLKKLSRELNERHKKDSSIPLPILIDLRRVQRQGEDVPTLEEILGSIQREWKGGGAPALEPRQIVEAVQKQGALIIFDGLDEIIVHLPPDRARHFIRELWKVLPPFKDGKKDPSVRRGKMVISCRSHYFKDVWTQNAMLTGEDREGIKARDYSACILLPFDDEQVRAYLMSVLEKDEGRVESALELFKSVHNLSELAQRPYLLAVMVELIEELERMKAAGKPVLGVTLYDLLVRKWLNRDDGKHHFSDTHKRLMMEHLAADMWREGAREWEWEKVENWLVGFLHSHPVLATHYAAVNPEVRNEDLRTATFILRPDESQNHFRFAHTSLQEYFLACHLSRALDEAALNRWDMELPSLETLDFLGQLLSLKQEKQRVRSLEPLLSGMARRSARLAFRYWLLAAEKGYPEPWPNRAELNGLDLEGWTIAGSPRKPLALSAANLSGTRLEHARLRHVFLADADFSDASLRLAVLENVTLDRASFERTDVTGATFHTCEAERLRGKTARWHDADWIASRMEGALLPDTFALAGTLSGCLFEGRKRIRPISSSWEAVIRDAHRGSVTCCAWSPDGKRLLSGSEDKTLRVWDSDSGRCLLTLKEHTSPVRACAWSPDCKRLLSGSSDQTLRVWDSETGRCLLTLKEHTSPVRACAWSPDGKRLLSGSEDKTLRVWDSETGRCLLTLKEHRNPVWACAWSQDGKRLLSGSSDKTLRVWDSKTGRCLLTLKEHGNPVSACAWSPDGKRLLSGSWDKTLRVWDSETGRCLLTLKEHGNRISACAWSPDGKRLLSGSYDYSLRVWDSDSGRCLLTLKEHGNRVSACAWSPDGKRLLSGSYDYSLRVWDSGSGRCLLTLDEHTSAVMAGTWSPDGKRLLSGSEDKTLRVWDSETGRCLLTLDEHTSAVMAGTWSPDGKRLLSGSEDKTLRVWDSETGRCLLTLKEHTSPVRACAWSPDCKRLLSGSSDQTLRVWDSETGRCLLILKEHTRSVSVCAWSSDCKRLLSGSEDNTLRVWDSETGRCLLTLDEHTSAVMAGTWSPDGKRLLSGSSDQTLRVWDSGSGRCLLTLKEHTSGVNACAWSPDGKRLLSGSSDQTLRVWDSETGRCLLTLDEHTDTVWACAWSPDGKRLLSGSFDNTLRVWDSDSGRCLAIYYLGPDREAAALDGEQRRILWASPGAWRFLGWRVYDEAAGRIRILPAEWNGPLPT